VLWCGNPRDGLHRDAFAKIAGNDTGVQKRARHVTFSCSMLLIHDFMCVLVAEVHNSCALILGQLL
jgi:hypothetical protein